MTSPDTFRQDLRWEKRVAREPWCERVCREFFKYFRSMKLVEDILRQRQGIDRIIQTYQCKEILIDDKMDNYFAENFFLEYRTGRRGLSKGWLEKDAHTDYLMYAFVNEGVCYFIPFQQLQRVWFQHKDDWIDEYGVERAYSSGHATKGATVPIEVVIASGVHATEIRFEREAEQERW